MRLRLAPLARLARLDWIGLAWIGLDWIGLDGTCLVLQLVELVLDRPKRGFQLVDLAPLPAKFRRHLRANAPNVFTHQRQSTTLL